jgi:chemotaxis protein MotB
MATGSGSEVPLVAGASAAALAQNRRIEFKLDER